MARSIVLLSGIVLALGLCRAVAAAAPHLVYPRPSCPNNGAPNAGVYGYFPTTWRAWPCEERLEITNPRSIGAEHLSTPQGQEQLPLPQATAAPQQPLTVPGGATPPARGAAIPEPQGPGAPVTPPALPKGEKPATPPPEGGLPGLPVEPDQPQTPGLPKAGATPLPSLDLNPPSQPAKETTKPSEAVPTPGKPQPSEESKPKEQPKSQDLPKPSSTNKSLPGARYESTPRTTTTAASFEQPAVPRDLAISPSGGRRAQLGRDGSGAYHAEAIIAIVPEPSPNDIEATNYKVAEPPIQLQFIDHGVAGRPVP